MTSYQGHEIPSSHKQNVPNKNIFIKDLSHAKDRLIINSRPVKGDDSLFLYEKWEHYVTHK